MTRSEISLAIDQPHPLLRVEAFVTELPRPLGEIVSPAEVVALLQLDADAPLQRSEELRAHVRNLLRWGGYKPTGRGKPASEYLIRAATEGGIGSINFAVDCCNAVSLHSGLPISVVDLDLAAPPFRIRVAEQGAAYAFNPTGQEIDLAGLVCLFDAHGACANAVRDSQRTKTHAATTRTLSVLWAPRGAEERLGEASEWYRSLLALAGGQTHLVGVDGTGMRD